MPKKKPEDIDLDFLTLENETDLFGVENEGLTFDSKTDNPVILRALKERIKEKVKEKLAHLIKPINAQIIKDYIPKPDQSTFFLMNGNCQFVDFISEFVKCIEPVEEIYLTTLSLNEHTFDSLDRVIPNITKNILVSSYFLATDKNGTLPKMRENKRLNNYNIGFFRNHTKMVLIKTKSNYYLFTGSANLRSSATIEQFSIYNSENLYNFNKKWISYLIEKYNFEKEFKFIKNTGQGSFYFMEDFEF
jgi:hypothetical protein